MSKEEQWKRMIYGEDEIVEARLTKNPNKFKYVPPTENGILRGELASYN